MAERSDSGASTTKSPTKAERTSERELVVKRTVSGPARLVFEAWTKPELFQRWWVPKSYGLTLLSCEMDVRVGGQCHLAFQHGDSTMAFFGTYREVTPPSRLVWTNEDGEDGEDGETVTFDERDGKTSLVVHDLYPSKEALNAAIASGATGGMPDQLDQLEAFLAGFRTSSEGA